MFYITHYYFFFFFKQLRSVRGDSHNKSRYTFNLSSDNEFAKRASGEMFIIASVAIEDFRYDLVDNVKMM